MSYNHEIHFTSLNQMADYLEKNTRKINDVKDYRTKWAGENWETSMKKLRYGDQELLNKFIKEVGELSVSSSGMSTERDVCGAFVDVNAFLHGVPENMFEFVHTEDSKFVNINISTGFHADITVKEVFKKYTYVVKLIDLLESNGYRCKITMYKISVDSYHSQRNSSKISVDIKNYSEQLNLASLLYCCCNSAFMRRNCLAINEIHLSEIGFSGPGLCTSKTHIEPNAINIKSFYQDEITYTSSLKFKTWFDKVIQGTTHEQEIKDLI